MKIDTRTNVIRLRIATSAPFNLMAIGCRISEMDVSIPKGEESRLRKLWVNGSSYSQRVSTLTSLMTSFTHLSARYSSHENDTRAKNERNNRSVKNFTII